MHPVGIMQGRLSPMEGGRIQSFPVGTWQEEFAKARQAGLACIEWIYEAGTEQDNPLGSDAGIRAIRRIIGDSGVGVRSICADWFMAHRLIETTGAVSEPAREMLIRLLDRAATLEVLYIILPFVDASSLRTVREREGMVRLLFDLVPHAEAAGVELHLETDLPPPMLHEVFSDLNHPLIRANYDIGNSASLGYDPGEEFAAIGRWLGSVHIKDRMRHGTTVPLGSGSADIPRCLGLIESTGFDRFFILQTARVPGMDEVALAIYNRHFIETIWSCRTAQRA
ncbi:MAG: sugar phosphate isomerase/epimerase [Methanomicrobiales archaeon]|nr:sugar phosphate isomerase/epimerase [Methanomicrobiales archaeon]